MSKQIQNEVRKKSDYLLRTQPLPSSKSQTQQQLTNPSAPRYQLLMPKNQSAIQNTFSQQVIGSANLSAINQSVSMINANDDSTNNFIQENQQLLHQIQYESADSQDFMNPEVIQLTNGEKGQKQENQQPQVQTAQNKYKRKRSPSNKDDGVSQPRSKSDALCKTENIAEEPNQAAHKKLQSKSYPNDQLLEYSSNPNNQTFGDDSKMINQILKLQLEFKEEFKDYQLQADANIQDLQSKVANQQETIEFLCSAIKKHGINVFNQESLQDEVEENTDREKQEEDDETTNMYYFSMEEKIEHNQSSQYTQERNKCISEPEYLQRVPFEQNSTIQSQLSKLGDSQRNQSYRLDQEELKINDLPYQSDQVHHAQLQLNSAFKSRTPTSQHQQENSFKQSGSYPSDYIDQTRNHNENYPNKRSKNHMTTDDPSQIQSEGRILIEHSDCVNEDDYLSSSCPSYGSSPTQRNRQQLEQFNIDDSQIIVINNQKQQENFKHTSTMMNPRLIHYVEQQTHNLDHDSRVPSQAQRRDQKNANRSTWDTDQTKSVNPFQTPQKSTQHKQGTSSASNFTTNLGFLATAGTLMKQGDSEQHASLPFKHSLNEYNKNTNNAKLSQSRSPLPASSYKNNKEQASGIQKVLFSSQQQLMKQPQRSKSYISVHQPISATLEHQQPERKQMHVDCSLSTVRDANVKIKKIQHIDENTNNYTFTDSSNSQITISHRGLATCKCCDKISKTITPGCCSGNNLRGQEQKSELRGINEPLALLKILKQQNKDIGELLCKNLSAPQQRDIISALVVSFVQNKFKYGSLMALNASWWSQWCKYTNYNDSYFLVQLMTKQDAFRDTSNQACQKTPIRNFNDLVKGKRPAKIENKDIIYEHEAKLKKGTYILVSTDIWTFFKAWYGADFKVEVLNSQVKPNHLPRREQQFPIAVYNAHGFNGNSSQHLNGLSEKTVFFANGNEDEEPASVSINDDDQYSMPQNLADANRLKNQLSKAVAHRDIENIAIKGATGNMDIGSSKFIQK